jgi:hypothetical protein
MAINPNTDFTAGQVLTAAQQNQFPRGIVAEGKRTGTDAAITTEKVVVTSSTFTAVANRYYKITFYEPEASSSSASYMQMAIRRTNISGTVLNAAAILNGNGTTTFNGGICIAYATFTAGSQVVVGTLACNAGTGKAGAAAANFAFILVEDIGPA